MLYKKHMAFIAVPNQRNGHQGRTQICIQRSHARLFKTFSVSEGFVRPTGRYGNEQNERFPLAFNRRPFFPV